MTHPATPFIQPALNIVSDVGRLLIKDRGTPDDPLYFDEGQTVPWWIEARFPLNLLLTFHQDVETFWLDGQQHIYPLGRSDYAMTLNGSGRHAWISGAPTVIHGKPRPGRPQRKPRELGVMEPT